MSRSAEARYELKEAAKEAGPAFWAQQQRMRHNIFSQQQPGVMLMAGGLPFGGLQQQQQAAIGFLPAGVSAVPGAQASYLRAAAQLSTLTGGVYVAPAESDLLDDPNWRATPRLEIYGNNKETFNVNPLLANCILNHEYTRRLWETGESFRALAKEARERVKHVEPWQKGTQRTPSTAFCILVRFFQLGLHEGHLRFLLESNVAYLRCLAYLYLRYACEPSKLWKWCEPGLHDDTLQTENLCGSSPQTVSQWLRGLLTDQKYYGTVLPRIPVKIERDVRVRLTLVDESFERAKRNAKFVDELLGQRVRAIYGDEANDPAWYDAIVDAKCDKNKRHKFWVTFPDYGNTELVRLGDLDLTDFIAAKKKLTTTTTQTRASTDKKEEDNREHKRGDYYYEEEEEAAISGSRRPKKKHKDKHRRRRSPSSSESYDKEEERHRHHHRRRSRSRDLPRDRSRRADRSPRGDNDDDRDRSKRRSRRSRDHDDDKHRREHNYHKKRDRRRDEDDGEIDDRRGPRTGESLLAGGDRLQRVIDQQRAAASSATDYARRPPGYKEALAMKIDRYQPSAVVVAPPPHHNDED